MRVMHLIAKAALNWIRAEEWTLWDFLLYDRFLNLGLIGLDTILCVFKFNQSLSESLSP
jgi:hypothetical protein